MQILYVTHHFTPDIVAGALRAYKHTTELAKLNHKINVITSNSGNFLSDSTFNIPNACSVTRVSGFHIPYLPAGYGYVRNFVNAGLKYSNEIDTILATAPTISAVIAGYKISKKINKPLVSEIRDPWLRGSNSAKLEKGGSHISINSLQGKLFKNIQRKILTYSKKIIVTNNEIITEITKIHPELSVDKFVVVYNAAELDTIKSIRAEKFAVPTIFCSGVLYRERGIDLLIKALALTNNIQLVFAGFAPEQDMRYYEKLIYDLDLRDRVHFLGIISPGKSIALQKGADILFVGQSDPKLNYQLPARTLEYMAVGKPILALAIKNSGLDNLITLHNCGQVVYSHNPSDLAAAIKHLQNKKFAVLLGRAGKSAVVRELNLKTQIKKLEAALS